MIHLVVVFNGLFMAYWIYRQLKTPAKCVECGAMLPKFRGPRTVGQLLWGGWTCQQCGCELNCYGQVRA